MTITTRQFEQLTEMGISLWQSRASNDIDTVANKKNVTNSSAEISTNNIDYQIVIKKPFFQDVLYALNLSIGEVTVQSQHLDLGLFNWQFNSSTANNENISYQNNILITPDITTIAHSAKLKRQLWQILHQHLI